MEFEPERKRPGDLESISDFEEMEFDEMKVIWDSQNEEKLYAINEQALYAQIQRKGKSVRRLLQRFELVMVGVNTLVGIVLFGVAWINESPFYAYLLALAYLVYAVVAWVWRRSRRQQDVRFDSTMLGELDKAIWQVNYMIKRNYELMLWYLIPLTLVMIAYLLYEGMPLLALAIGVVMGLSGFVTDRWEIKRDLLPKKESLESLRTTLTAAEG